jgi:hypothetical protein
VPEEAGGEGVEGAERRDVTRSFAPLARIAAVAR